MKSSQSSHDDEMDGLLQRSRRMVATPLKAIIAEHIMTRYGPLSALILKPGGCWVSSRDVMTSMTAAAATTTTAMDLGSHCCLIFSRLWDGEHPRHRPTCSTAQAHHHRCELPRPRLPHPMGRKGAHEAERHSTLASASISNL